MKKLFIAIVAAFVLVGFVGVVGADSIKCSCVEEWSNDYEMQEYCINEQKAAKYNFHKMLLNYLDKKGTEFRKGFEKEAKICLRAMSEWKTNSSKCGNGYDWEMVLYETKNQLASYNRIK